MSERIGLDPRWDLPSPEVSESQARSFCVRALRAAATRLNDGNKEWEEIEVSLSADNGEYPHYGFHFRAMQEEYDEDDDELIPETYAIEIMHDEPVYSWDGKIAVPSLQSQIDTEEDKIFIEPFDEGDEDDEPFIVGNLVVTEKFLFSIFKQGRGCNVTKAVDYAFVDEEEDVVDAELAYRTDALTQPVSEEDLQNLYRYGELLLDTQLRESEQSTLTVFDLEMILNQLRRARLVGSRMRAVQGKPMELKSE